MYFIISELHVALLVALYFLFRYLHQTFLKFAVGCEKPFDPFYSYRDYPTWDKAYAKGHNDAVKQMKEVAEGLKEVASNLSQDARRLQKAQENNNAVH
jgi:hypothetical protein